MTQQIISQNALLDGTSAEGGNLMINEKNAKITYCCGLCSKTLEVPNRAYFCSNCGSSDDLFVIYQEEEPANITMMYTTVDWHGG